MKAGKCRRINRVMPNNLQKKRKKFWFFIGGMAAIFVGSWMIFYLKNNWGFIPAAIGFFTLIWSR